MKFQELMMQSLTDLLKPGETLYYPIYGILKQGNNKYYGFFGFTEEFLLVALTKNKQITYTTRVPLKIKSVKIKRTSFLKKYEINISFDEGAPCMITAHSDVLNLNTQKTNFPLFLEYLKNKSPKIESGELNSVDGKKIRCQYFNTLVYLLLSFYPMPIITVKALELKQNIFDISRTIELAVISTNIWCIFLAPLIILALLNRFCFGKIISVATTEGLVLENDIILWSDIQKITYNPQNFIASRFKFTDAEITVKPANRAEYTFNLLHFPFYGFKIIKKYNKDIEIKIGKDGLYEILSCALIPTVIAVVISFFICK